MSNKPDKITRYDLSQGCPGSGNAGVAYKKCMKGRHKRNKKSKIALETIAEENSSTESLF